jgi:hypothetical protein
LASALRLPAGTSSTAPVASSFVDAQAVLGRNRQHPGWLPVTITEVVAVSPCSSCLGQVFRQPRAPALGLGGRGGRG